MYYYDSLSEALSSGACDERLAALYGLDGRQESVLAARNRALRILEAFREAFAPSADTPIGLFSGPGRTEIGGNHTDHQHGRVLCGSVDLDMLACAAPNGSDVVRVLSEGYPRLEVDLADLNPVSAEEGSSAALVRGVAKGLTKLGHQLHGVDVYMNSTVLSGSGLSSSAAYEILIGVIFNYFFCEGKEDAVSLARIGQYAENVHFGKPCGLMDQMGSAVGGAVSIDFANPAAPHVHPVAFDFSRSGHALCIVDTGSDHADLTADYAAIPAEMGSVAAFFGKQYLREVSYELFWDAIPALRRKCGDRAVLRALHFYEDDARVARDVEALEAGDFEAFLANIRSSGLSSALHLQNIWSVSNPRNQAVAVTLALGERLLAGKGAIRVHGGGFAGTVQAFVPNEMVPVFRFGMETVLGRGKCHILHIRPEGGCVVIA